MAENFEKYRWTFEDPNEAVLLDIVKRLRKVSNRSRKNRHDLVQSAIAFLGRAVKESEEAISVLDDCIDTVMDVFITVSEILFQLLEEGEGIVKLASDFNSYICVFLEHLQLNTNFDIFLEQTKKLHEFYITLVVNNQDTWLYILVAGGPLELISLAMFSMENQTKWCDFCSEKMLRIDKSITSCGDFECQRTLLIALINWLENVSPQVKCDFLERSFRIVPSKYRESLFKDFTKYDADYKCRYFLNSVNEVLLKSNKLSAAYSLPCPRILLEGRALEPAKHPQLKNFWVDFSCKSRRIHFYCSFSSDWQNVSIQNEQIESICVFYPDHLETRCQLESVDDSDSENRCSGSGSPAASQSECYFHLRLNCSFDSVCQDISQDNFGQSLIFEFNEIEKVEEILQFFQFEMHECEFNSCKRLVPAPENIGLRNRKQNVGRLKSKAGNVLRPVPQPKVTAPPVPVASPKTPDKVNVNPVHLHQLSPIIPRYKQHQNREEAPKVTVPPVQVLPPKIHDNITPVGKSRPIIPRCTQTLQLSPEPKTPDKDNDNPVHQLSPIIPRYKQHENRNEGSAASRSTSATNKRQVLRPGPQPKVTTVPPVSTPSSKIDKASPVDKPSRIIPRCKQKQHHKAAPNPGSSKSKARQPLQHASQPKMTMPTVQVPPPKIHDNIYPADKSRPIIPRYKQILQVSPEPEDPYDIALYIPSKKRRCR